MRLTILLSATLLSVLIFLSFFAQMLDRDTRRYGAALAALDELELADTNINSDILKARAGLLRNYDSLVAGNVRARAALQRLARLPQDEPELTRAIAELDRVYAAKEVQLELFKSQNSLLTNSLAYFWRQSTRQILGWRDAEALRAASALTSAVHRLSLDTSADAVEQARERLAGAAMTEAVAPLLPHGRMLVQLLPETDATISRMRPVSSLPAFVHVQRYLTQRQAALQHKAKQIRIYLLLLAIAMLAVLMYLALLLRHRARALRRRSTFGKMMVAISRDLVSRDRAEMDAAIASALRRLAQWLSQPRAALALVQTSGHVRLWPEHDDAELKATVAAVSAEAGDPAHRDHDIVLLLEDGSTVRLLQSEDVCLRTARWLCIRRRTEAGTSALLCFKRGREFGFCDRFGEFTLLLNTALDTLADALERSRLENEAHALERRLERARRMETIGTMASGISHNFNNIVGAIRGNAEAASIRLSPGTPEMEHMAEISRATEHARELVEAILGFGRAQNYSMQMVELNALLQETVSLLAVSLPSSVELDVRREPIPLCGWGNPAQLQQVILNLVTNAAQAMALRGTVLIRLSASVEARSLARLHVVDHGVGIPADRLERIFDPFFTTRDGGTGLGLATVKQIVGNHEGRIEVRSEPGVGTTFLVELPLSVPDHSVAADDTLARPPQHNTLLVLCDDATALERVEDVLAALGHEPVGHLDSAAAARALAEFPGRFDGALVDRDRTGDAVAAVHALHVAAPRLPLILATRCGALPASAGLSAAITEIIVLPADPATLAQAVERATAPITTPRASVTTEIKPR